jgi:hypothetical protein
MSTALDILPSALVLAGRSQLMADITGGGRRRLYGNTGDGRAWECFWGAANGVQSIGDIEPCEVLEGLASQERRRGSRPLLGRVTDFNSPMSEDNDVAGGDWSEQVLDADTARDLALAATIEGKLIRLAGGPEYTGRAPRGGIVGSVARYTMRRFGLHLPEQMRCDAAACAVAAMWHAGTVGCQGGWCIPAGDAAIDEGLMWSWLWRVGWRAARRHVVQESRGGMTGSGADRRGGADVSFDAHRPIGRGVTHGCIDDAPVTLADLSAWDTDDCAQVPAYHDTTALMESVAWVYVVLASAGPAKGVGARAARCRAVAVCELMIGAHEGVARDELWKRAAAVGHFACSDALMESLRSGRVWERLRCAALSIPSEGERIAASHVAAWAKAARHWRAAGDWLALFRCRGERALWVNRLRAARAARVADWSAVGRGMWAGRRARRVASE